MDTNKILPLAALRNVVVMPNTVVTFDVERKFSKLAFDESINGNGYVILATQKTDATEVPELDDLFLVGTLCKIKQIIKRPDMILRVMVEGVKRVELLDLVQTKPYYKAEYITLNTYEPSDVIKGQALLRSLKKAVDEYVKFTRIITLEELKRRVKDVTSLDMLCDNLIGMTNIDYIVKQQLLETEDAHERIEMFVAALGCEVEIFKVQNEINLSVKERMAKNQQEFILREEKRIIEEKLGETIDQDAQNYRDKIEKLSLDTATKEKLLKETRRLEKMASSSADASVLTNYLDTVLELPWNEKTEDNLSVENVLETLNNDHYGIESVKERIIEQIAVRKLTDGKYGTLLCLVGPPGTGKTSIAKSIADALGRKYVRISLGGVRDEAEIRGHRKTYIGAMPGRIMAAMISAKSKNPLILLDEIDKMSSDIKGDPASALLEVLDYEQNHSFKDHFVEVEFDLSEVMFVTTANNLNNIPKPLLDRLEVIELSGYTNLEKTEIVKRHLIPKQAKKNGLEGKRYKITDEAVALIIEGYTKEAGVRQTERNIASLMRKMAKKFVMENRKSIKITKNNLSQYLGVKKYDNDKIDKKDEVGVVRGLAWTSVGGETLNVEVCTMEGKGKIELTGNLGDVMQESCKTAIGYIRSISDYLKIDPKFYNTTDIHIHVPEGAVPKDGPSAGITIATAVASALTGKKVRRDVAMTGEITLRGKVLAIGGLKEKTIAALQSGVKKVIVPKSNKDNLADLPQEVKDKLEFIVVSDTKEVFKNALI